MTGNETVESVTKRRPRPVPGPTRPYKFPAFNRTTLENGLTVLVAPVTKLPLVSVTAIIDGGAVSEPRGREGVAHLMAKLLLEGTIHLDGAELTERFERLGASVEAYADWDVAAVTMTVMAEHLRPAFELLTQALRSPAFREREVHRLKGERLAELLQLRSEPRGLADESFITHAYESGSRFALSDAGDDVSVAAITRDDIVAFHLARVVPGSTTIIVAGQVTAESGLTLVQQTLGDWNGPIAPRGLTADGPARRSRALFIVAKPDAPQTELRIGHLGVPRSHPDYFSLVVMNSVLGGLFNSRINLNLREAHGYTYSAFSAFDWRRQVGPFVVSTAVRTDVTADAVREVRLEIERMHVEPVTEAELALATSYLDGVFPIRYETTSAIAAALANLVVYGLADDYFDTYRSRIRGVSAADVLSVAQRHLMPDRLLVVAVGDPAIIRVPLEQLDIGPTVVEPGTAGAGWPQFPAGPEPTPHQ